MKVSGTNNTFLDGRYMPTGNYTNGQKCYQKADASKAMMCMGLNHYWLVQPEAKAGQATGYMMSSVAHMEAPQLAGPWKLFVDNAWVTEASIQVEPVTDAISWTVTLLTCGSLAVIGVICWLAVASVPDLRELLYAMLSKVFTCFIGFFSTAAIFHYVSQALLPADTDACRTFLAFTLYTASYLAMIVVMWKVQYSSLRCAAVRTLGASITAFFGIITAKLIQDQVAAAFPGQVKGSGITDFTAKLIGAVIVLIFTWGLSAVYREASLGLRVEKLKEGPVVPWSAKNRFAVPSSVEKRMCTNPFASAAPAEQPFGEWEGWQDQLEWGEDIVAVLVESFLMNQVIFFYNTQRFPELMEPVGMVEKESTMMWIAQIVTFLLAGVAVYGLRKKLGDMSRWGRGLQYSVAMCPSWQSYRLAHIHSMNLYPDCRSLADVSAAFGLTIVCILAMRIIGLVNIPDEVAWGNVVFGVALCFGNIIGLSWAAVATDSFDTFGLHNGWQKFNADANGHSKIAFPWWLVLCAGAGFTWWKTILPRSETGRKTFTKLIAVEDSILLTPE